MRRLFVSFFALIISFHVYSQDLSYARMLVDTLASDSFFGRGYVNNGINLAADFIENEYAAHGLKNFNDSYNQTFEISVNAFPSSAELWIDNKKLIPGKEFIFDANSSEADTVFKVYKVNHNDLTDIEKLKSIIDKSAGKLLLIDKTKTLNGDKATQKQVNEIIQFLKYDNKLSISGVIIYSEDKLTWNVGTVRGCKPIIYIDAKKIKLGKAKKIKIKLKAQFDQAFPVKNIVGYMPGTEYPDSFLVFTAHYDHLGMMGQKTIFPGANDNASGVAMLLSLAKYFAENLPKYSIAFIALASEEAGLLGAKHYTEYPLFPLEKIKFLINFDLAGTGDEGIKVVNGTVYKDKFDLLTKLNTQHKLLPAIKIRGEACISDHCLFYRKGVPSFYMYTLGGISAYHDIYDVPETLPLTEFEDYFRLIHLFVEEL